MLSITYGVQQKRPANIKLTGLFTFTTQEPRKVVIIIGIKGIYMRHPGVEPGSQEPESWVLSITLAAQPNMCTQQYNILF